MKSELFAIADAGGNIYPGTFFVSEQDAWLQFLFPEQEIFPFPFDFGDARKRAEKNGNHLVRCLIETNEVVTVKSAPA